MKTKYILIFLSIFLFCIPGVLAVGETVSTLDKILEIVIPLVVVGLFIAMIYKGFKEPIDRFLHWIKTSISGEDNEQNVYEPRYKNSYMAQGDVQYMR